MVDFVHRNYCKQCERFIHEEETTHFTEFPDHVLTEYTVASGYAETVGNLPHQHLELPRMMNYSYYNMNTNNSVYTTKAYVFFPGKSEIGEPTKIEVVSKLQSNVADGGQIRIYDATNDLVIAEGYISGNKAVVHDLGVLSNISDTEAIWELQMRKVSKKTFCYALHVKF